MADVKTITIENVTYNIKDASARATATTANDTANTASAGVTALGARVTALETASANHVTLTSEQTITGKKIFSGDNASVARKSTDIDVTVTPESSQYLTGTLFQDKNSVRMGVCEVAKQQTTGNIDIYLAPTVVLNGVTTHGATIGSYISPDGTTKCTYAQTPAVSSNSTEIATTSYINNKFKYVAALPSSPDGDTFYFIPE